MIPLRAFTIATLLVLASACESGGETIIVISNPAKIDAPPGPQIAAARPVVAAPESRPTPTPELLTPTPAPHPEIYIETGEVFMDTWMGEPVIPPPREVSSLLDEAPSRTDAAAAWREYFLGTRVLANGVTYELCEDGSAIYVSGAPGRWPDGTKFNYLLLPYPARFGFDSTHIELQVASADPQFRYSRGRYDAYHFANVDGYTVGIFFDGTLIDAPVIQSTMC